MMMSSDGKKKGIAALIVSKLSNGKEKESEKPMNEAGDEIDSSAGHDSAVEEMFSAFETKDKNKFKVALESFIELCFNELESKPHEESESEEDEEE